MNIEELLGIRLPRRHNTRRNRKRALLRRFNQIDDDIWKQPPHWSAMENRIRCTAHLADNLELGVTLKTYSAWCGCRVRELSKHLDDYRRGRLPGQKEITL